MAPSRSSIRQKVNVSAVMAASILCRVCSVRGRRRLKHILITLVDIAGNVHCFLP